MNPYTFDPTLFDFANFSNPIVNFDHRSWSSSADDDYEYKTDYGEASAVSRRNSPPKHRHDGKSPLPLGMDWSLPPPKWEGQNSVWPYDPHTGWSYCATIPSWILLQKPRGSDPVVFFRVEVGIQSPEGITTTREILQRFSDFLKLHSELKKEFPGKTLPPAPPRRILRMKSRTMLEERRCSLEEWMHKLLSDIDISRCVSVALFLELEAAARSSFYDDIQQNSDVNHSLRAVVPSSLLKSNSDISVFAECSSITSDNGNEFPDSISEIETLKSESKVRIGRDDITDFGVEASTSGQNITDAVEIPAKRDGMEYLANKEYYKFDGHARGLSSESVGSDLSTVKESEASNFGVANLFGEDNMDLAEGADASRTRDTLVSSDIHFSRDSLILPSFEQQKLIRVLNTVQRRLCTGKTDMEDLTARLNQEVAVRKFLATKVKDLEVEIETTRHNCKENMQQAALTEREKFTQMQWDVEEFRSRCLEMELKLKSEQDDKACVELAKASIIQGNEMLLQELGVAREQLEKLHEVHEELEVKSKADLKVLVKEVKSLRISQSELKQELSRLMKEKLELEKIYSILLLYAYIMFFDWVIHQFKYSMFTKFLFHILFDGKLNYGGLS
ncbi:PX domain-containing protein EREX-like isoform X2 [Tripterygium wilfordii]|uniref:PX domain-containing protein EREX-like isoform X2 n=1 Tax=Tripterygium wilfordii TaxID=458696 RepID=UPI0018F7E97C|nr:PX domain-containing protein EREX-like isoform X2 [Tripterygium wilfordii]